MNVEREANGRLGIARSRDISLRLADVQDLAFVKILSTSAESDPFLCGLRCEEYSLCRLTVLVSTNHVLATLEKSADWQNGNAVVFAGAGGLDTRCTILIDCGIILSDMWLMSYYRSTFLLPFQIRRIRCCF